MREPAAFTSMRLLHLLQAVPTGGRRRSVRDLSRELETLGYQVSLRTIQRDLEGLEVANLAYSDGEKPAGWTRGSKGLGLELRDPAEALALEILDRHARHLLPPSIAERLRKRVDEARATLGIHTGSGLAQWAESIAVVPLSQPLIPPDVIPSVHSVVLQALLERRVLVIDYKGAQQSRFQERKVHPAGLVAREGQFVLVAFFEGNPQPYQLLLHRIRRAQALEDPARVPADFDFKKYARSAEMGMPTGRTLRLVLTLDEQAGRFFEESKLSANQEVEQYVLKRGDVRYRVTATVDESERLEAYLNSLGGHLIRRTQKVIASPEPA